MITFFVSSRKCLKFVSRKTLITMKNVYLQFSASPFGNRFQFAENYDENDDFMFDSLFEKFKVLIFENFKFYSVWLHRNSGKTFFDFKNKEIKLEESKFKVIIRNICDDLTNYLLGTADFSFSQEYHFRLFGIDLFICINYSEKSDCNDNNDLPI